MNSTSPGPHDPTPEQIAQRAAQIRSSWPAHRFHGFHRIDQPAAWTPPVVAESWFALALPDRDL